MKTATHNYTDLHVGTHAHVSRKGEEIPKIIKTNQNIDSHS